jgi:hypothetical protein
MMKSTPPSAGARPGTGTLVELYRDEYVLIQADPRGPLVRYTRTAAPFPSLDALDRTMNAVNEALDRYGRRGRVLFSDARAAPGRNDPAFEAAMHRHRMRIYQGMQRIGVLVQTTIGKLHLERLAREDGVERKISLDEAEIYDYVLGDAPPSAPASRATPSQGRRGT